jgi:hypothetical protein
MKTIVALTVLFTLPALAAPVRAVSCQAHCLGIDWQRQEVASFGSLEGLARDQRRAYTNLTKSCNRKLARGGFYGQVYLAQGELDMSSSISTRESESSSYAEGYTATRWSFSEWSHSASSYSFKTDSDLRVRLQLTSPRQACESVTVDETELIPVYDGDLPVLG